ncbi:MAG: crossover junction endodeoxyribonuclease RuvC [Burkholderiaceae bacterium]|jgi:crossover junction endodeoxyribonuclease RuvC
MRILGIDPGLRVTGYGVIDCLAGHQQYVSSGVIRSNADASLPERLHTLFRGVVELVEQYRPQVAAVEIVFVNVNPQSTLLLGQARGAALTALTHAGVAVTEYTALQIKQSTVGYGRASKEQMQCMVQRLLSLPGLPGTDAADALATALTHAQAGHLLQALSAAAPSASLKAPRIRKGRASWG